MISPNLSPSPARIYIILRIVSAFAFSLIITYELIYHTATIGLNPLQLVLVGVVLETMTLLGEVPTGVVADSVSRRLSILIGLGCIGMGFLIEGIWATYPAVLAAQIVWGLGFTFYSGAGEAWITDEIGEKAAAPLFLKATEWGQWANLAGIAVASWLVISNTRWPIIAGSLIYLVLTGWLVLVMPEDGFTPSRATRTVWEKLAETAAKGLRLAKTSVMMRLILGVGVIIGLYVGGFDRLYVAHFLQNLPFPAPELAESLTWFGLFRAVIAIGTVIGTWLLRQRLDLADEMAVIKTLQWSFGGMIGLSLIFIFSGHFIWAAAAFCLSQILRFIGRPLLIVWINANAPSAVRATAISLYWQANGVGQIMGSPLIGWLATVRSIQAALTAGVAAYVAAPLLLWRARRIQNDRS